MIAVATVLLAFPLGLLLRRQRRRGRADGSPSLSYLAVTLAVYAAGFGLVALGHAARERGDRSPSRRRRQAAPCPLS